MKKILVTIDTLGGGGAEKVLTKVLEMLPKDKYSIDIFVINKQGVYLNKLQKDYNIIALNHFRNNRLLCKIIRKIKTAIYFKFNFLFNRLIPNKYDVEIAFLEGRTTKLIASRTNNARKLAWVHTDIEKHRTLSLKEEKFAYAHMDKIVCVSEEGKEKFIKLFPEYSEKVKVIYNPIDKEEIIRKSQEKITKNDEVLVVSVGRLNYVKGYDILLQVHNDLIKEGIKHKLLIIGEGEEREVLQKYIDENDLKESVQLIGFKENPYPYIANSDIFVSSSRYEGYALVIAEAIVLGKPIVATSCTGPSEILENNKYGVVVEKENKEMLKIVLSQLITDQTLRMKYSKLAEKRSEIFNISETMEKIKYIIDNE